MEPNRNRLNNRTSRTIYDQVVQLFSKLVGDMYLVRIVDYIFRCFDKV
ncbi:unnamed protein product [Arabidopsis halleri]